MQLVINTSSAQSQLESSQIAFNRTTNSRLPQQTAPALDYVALSEESRRPKDAKHAVSQLDKRDPSLEDNLFQDFLKDMVGQIIGSRVDDLKTLPTQEDALQPQDTSLSVQQASLSLQSTSISISGTINTSDGAKVSFALDLQMLQASASIAEFNFGNTPDGFAFSYAGSAAELTSSSFSFTLSAETPDGAPANSMGEGTFSLKDEMKEVRHDLKPLVKEFFKDAGNPSGWSNVNRLLHAVA